MKGSNKGQLATLEMKDVNYLKNNFNNLINIFNNLDV